MKSIYRILFIASTVLLFGCQQRKQIFTEAEKETIKKEVKDQFNQLVTSLNQLDTLAWSEFYSKDNFASAFVSTDFYSDRTAFVETISTYFTMRKSQLIDPQDIQVAILAPDVALMTSQEKTEMMLMNGQIVKSNHVFTMIWKKQQEGWKIIHSHESWVDESIE